MARSLRLKFPGPLYYVASFGDTPLDIVFADGERTTLLATLAHVIDRFD